MDELLSARDSGPIKPLPRVFGDAQLVATNCFTNFLERQFFSSAELGDSDDVCNHHPLGLLNEHFVAVVGLLFCCRSVALQTGGKRPNQGAPKDVVRLWDHDRPDARIVHDEPAREVIFLAANPHDRVEL